MLPCAGGPVEVVQHTHERSPWRKRKLEEGLSLRLEISSNYLNWCCKSHVSNEKRKAEGTRSFSNVLFFLPLTSWNEQRSEELSERSPKIKIMVMKCCGREEVPCGGWSSPSHLAHHEGQKWGKEERLKVPATGTAVYRVILHWDQVKEWRECCSCDLTSRGSGPNILASPVTWDWDWEEFFRPGNRADVWRQRIRHGRGPPCRPLARPWTGTLFRHLVSRDSPGACSAVSSWVNPPLFPERLAVVPVTARRVFLLSGHT